MRNIHVMNNTQQEEWLSTADATKRAGVSVSTLYRYEEAGLLSPVRTPGGHRRYRASEIDALMQGRPA